MTAVPTPDAFASAARLFIKVNGAVQGVGMRPFVHRLAMECGLTGYVRNGADGVTIEVEGARVEEFLHRLSSEAPPLARIDTVHRESMRVTGGTEFVIRESLDGETMTRIVADAAT